jgi:DNA polymerase III delta prime subunit
MTTSIHESRFPAELLTLPTDVRRDYFLKKTINHPHLGDAMTELLEESNRVSASDITILTGPTGVGKTTLGARLEADILEDHRQAMAEDLNFLPVVRISAVAPNQGTFSWKDFYVRLLRMLDETQVRQRVLFPIEHYRMLDAPRGRAGSTCHDAALQRATENAIRERRTLLLIIDEAHHMLLAAKGKRLREQFEAIKSLSIATSATIVLIGTYDLLTILEQSAQLIRRSHVVHLPRYAWEDRNDAQAFRTALLTFQRHMPFPVEPDLVSHAKSFYLKSAGCIGILKEWLNKAVESGLKKGLETIDYDYIDGFAHANKSIRQVYEEAMDGERKLVDMSDDDLLRYVEDETLSNKKDSSAKAKRGGVAQQVGKGSRKKRRPGQRNPVRDPVGMDSDLFESTGACHA